MLSRSCVSKRDAEDAGLVQGCKADEEFPKELEVIKTSEHPEAVPQNSPKRIFADLPVDVILMIFMYLDTEKIALSVLPVCKTWYDLGRNRILWKNIGVHCSSESKFSTSFLHSSIAVIQRAGLLRYLTLSIDSEISKILECVAKSCPLLHSLYLAWCSVKSSRAVRSVVSSCLCLQHLYMNDVNGSALAKFAEMTTLVELAVHDGQEYRIYIWTTDFWMRLSKNNRRLETVTYTSFALRTQEQLMPLLTYLNRVIKETRFSVFLCSSPAYRALAECENLVSLELDFPRHLLSSDLIAMEQLKKLETIYIKLPLPGSQNISPNAWKSFISKIGSDHIVDVYLQVCGNVEPFLYEVLSTRDDTILHRAKTVHLRHCIKLSDHCLKLILTRNPFLEHLSLRGSSGFEGLALNTTDASIAPAVRYLEFSFCPEVPSSYLRTFLKNRPGLTIIDSNRKIMKL